MKRPIGVTVIAVANFVAALAFLASETILAADPARGDLLIVLVVIVLISMGLSWALLKLQSWARWTSIVLYILSLIRIPARVISASGLGEIVSICLSALFVAWAVWYLFRPHVKLAFNDT
jgi:hypothetical protein